MSRNRGLWVDSTPRDRGPIIDPTDGLRVGASFWLACVAIGLIIGAALHLG